MWYLLVRERVFFLLWVADIMKLRPESCSLKKGRLDKTAEAFDTYVVLKVQNLKGTTIKRRGSEPCWEQDFMFEIGADEKGFTVELWKKGLLWDGILGILWIPLSSVEHATDEGPGAWWTLHSEVIKNGIEIQGTRTPTSHELLLDVYFAIPFDMHEDLDYRGCNKEMLLQGTKHSHKDECDNLSSVESGLHIQENKLRNISLEPEATLSTHPCFQCLLLLHLLLLVVTRWLLPFLVFISSGTVFCWNGLC